MSAPQTNLEKQKRFHRGPLIGMMVVVVFALALLFFWVTDEVENAENPGEDVPAEIPTLTEPSEQTEVAPAATSTQEPATDPNAP